MVNYCCTILKEVDQNNEAQIVWVPGHTGIVGNQIVDKAAERKANSKFVGTELYCGLAVSTIKTSGLLNQNSKKLW